MKDFELYKKRIEATAYKDIVTETPLSKGVCVGALNRIFTATDKGDITSIIQVLDAVYYAGQHAGTGVEANG